MDYEWPSEANRTQALEAGIFKPEKITPLFMTVYGTRIFLSLDKFGSYNKSIPVSLVSLPTSSASSASPKLTPFPSWDMHEYGNCEKIEEARGIQVDSVGRLWVLDNGSKNCNSKLWTIDLANNHTKLIHRFSFHDWMHDLVLDETPNGTLAYIAYWGERNIVVFSLERNQSWIVQTTENTVHTIALSPKEEPRQLYIGKFNSKGLYSISVSALRNGTESANPELIGNWTAIPYRMLMDNHGTLYAAFWGNNQILSWNTSQPFEVQRFHKAGNLDNFKPFTFALDSSGTFWMTELNKTASMPRYRLLMAADNASSVTTARPSNTTNSPKTAPTPVSFSIPTTTTMAPESTPVTATASTQIHITTDIVENSTQLPELNHTTPANLSIPTTTKSSTPAEENAATEEQESNIPTKISNKKRKIINTVIRLIVLSSFVILFWLVLGRKWISSTLQNTTEDQEMSVFVENNDEVGSAEVQFEEITLPRPFRPVQRSADSSQPAV
ncbi:Hypothetical predicted protein [Cloeon dipterum]|uniref:Bee-milk protein n=1 Tax=Cloeon dipterum TaxID=197152 RepID=A0A8S1D172_9INSE|nr:Hypothetical predicted protein [Cloeon dipterum]